MFVSTTQQSKGQVCKNKGVSRDNVSRTMGRVYGIIVTALNVAKKPHRGPEMRITMHNEQQASAYKWLEDRLDYKIISAVMSMLFGQHD